MNEALGQLTGDENVIGFYVGKAPESGDGESEPVRESFNTPVVPEE